MDPTVFELLGSLLVGGMVWLTLLRRPRHIFSPALPVLAVKKVRPVSSSRRQRASPSKRVKASGTSDGSPKRKKRVRAKASEPTLQSAPATANAAAPLDTCPSCGLQAPDKLLAEHFLGSPSHRNGPAKVVEDTVPREPKNDLPEDESQQSVRNLLQILVPPRAFGRRHAHRSVSPIPSVVQDIGPGRRQR